MKRSIKNEFGILIIFIVLATPFLSLCDIGSCARFKINIVFDDGDSLAGYIQLCGYDAVKFLSEDEILQRMKHRAISDSITVYKKIQTINYPMCGAKHWGWKFSAVANEDKITIDVNRISKIQKLSVSRCEHGNFEEDDAYLINFTAQIIDDLSQQEIDLLQTKPYSQLIVKDPHAWDKDFCLNYNEDIDEEQLKQLCSLYLEDEKILLSKEFSDLQEQHYSETVKNLRDMSIIVIHIYGD